MRLLFATLFLLALARPAMAAEVADLELALAVDASGSVDAGEYTLQIEGIAAAFRDDAVKAAIRSAIRDSMMNNNERCKHLINNK